MNFFVAKCSRDHHPFSDVGFTVQFVYWVKYGRNTLCIIPFQVPSQRRWRRVIWEVQCIQLKTICQQLIRKRWAFPFLNGYCLLCLLSPQTTICTGNAIIAATGKDCATTTISDLFFSWNHFLKWLGKRAINERGGIWITEYTCHISMTPKDGVGNIFHAVSIQSHSPQSEEWLTVQHNLITVFCCYFFSDTAVGNKKPRNHLSKLFQV